MKVLTIKEPWATLIVEGYKKYEFRTWKTKYRGPFYIHAGLSTVTNKFDKLNLEYNNGYIIGECELTDVILVDDKFKDYLSTINEHGIYDIAINYNDGLLYAYKLENVKKIDKYKVKGKLGLWNI